MAKRELISKNSIISLYKYFSKGERVFAGQVIVDVKAIPPITEQEIVKPYLDKIRAEVLEYIDDVDIAYEICGIFDKYKIESEE